MSEGLVARLKVAMLLTVALLPAACARPSGDFGRPAPSALHDEVLPVIGKSRAVLAGAASSRFNLADEEREMRDRVWRFLVAPHAKDWFFDTAVELQRAEISGTGEPRFGADRYYRWLRSTRYQSSSVRYRTISDHVRADVGTMDATTGAVCAVIKLDRKRQLASSGFGGINAEEVHARRSENEALIGWFVRAARYRYEAYAFALDQLLVETPDRAAVQLDGELSELAIKVERAERGDFCSTPVAARHQSAASLPARAHIRVGRDPAVRK